MAETVHLFLTIDGKRVPGESTQTSLGRAGSIECLEVRDALTPTSRDGVAVDLRLVKRPDSSSVPLAQALLGRRSVAGEFRYFRPSPRGDGTTDHYLTITITDAKITGITRHSPNVFTPATAALPVTEEVVIAVGAITWTWTDTGDKATATTR